MLTSKDQWHHRAWTHNSSYRETITTCPSSSEYLAPVPFASRSGFHQPQQFSKLGPNPWGRHQIQRTLAFEPFFWSCHHQKFRTRWCCPAQDRCPHLLPWESLPATSFFHEVDYFWWQVPTPCGLSLLPGHWGKGDSSCSLHHDNLDSRGWLVIPSNFWRAPWKEYSLASPSMLPTWRSRHAER